MYLNKQEFLEEVSPYIEEYEKTGKRPKCSEKLAGMIQILAERIAYHRRLVQHMDKEELAGECFAQVLEKLPKFDYKNRDNPFAYFTSVVMNHGKGVIAAAHKEQKVKKKLHRFYEIEEDPARKENWEIHNKKLRPKYEVGSVENVDGNKITKIVTSFEDCMDALPFEDIVMEYFQSIALDHNIVSIKSFYSDEVIVETRDCDKKIRITKGKEPELPEDEIQLELVERWIDYMSDINYQTKAYGKLLREDMLPETYMDGDARFGR